MTSPHMPSLAAYGRRFHRSTCVVEIVEDGPLDPDTGYLGPEIVTRLYAGSCKTWAASSAKVVEHGEGPVTLYTYVVELVGPVAGIPPEAVVRFTSSPDPDLSGAVGRVLESGKSDTVSNRRLTVEVKG